jgi:hypothetical protein
MKEKHIYLLQIWCDVEPILHGQYTDEEARDIEAKRLRRNQGEDCGGLYPVTLDISLENMQDGVQHKLDVDTYSGAFFDEDCDICGAPEGETHLPACANHIERQGERNEQ